MRIINKMTVGLFGLCLFACSSVDLAPPNAETPVDNSSELERDWRRISDANVEVLLGTNNKKAPASERPQMRVVLEDGVFMMRHEVTCGEFNNLMGPSHGYASNCEDENVPVTNVTYYDAVLYANAKSKAWNVDTSYTYSSVTYDREHHCIHLEGLVFHPEVNAVRLPTEAEWVYAASKNWESAKGWTAENSDYKLHPVCSLAEEDEICDMIGNAMEWVNDWLGKFRDTVVSNYVGASDGGSLEERILKGGSYRNGASSITRYSRGDVYTVTSSMFAEYVGFRLAYGSISNPTWMTASGDVSFSRVVPVASLSKLQMYTHSNKVKLAFRDDVSGNLAYIDYLGSGMSVIEINDTLSVYHPEISPDGKKVAFCTGLEGVSGRSRLYVRDLNAEGTNLVKLDVKSAAIPRWRVLDSGDTVIVYVSDAGNNKDEGAFKATSTWEVPFAGGKFGKPRKLFDGAYHGGISEDGTLAVSGARLLRARIAESGSTVDDNAYDTVWYGGEQACNASLAKDGSKRTLFLDFAGETGQKFVGEKYRVHERLFLADSAGKLLRSVPAPSGRTFDHTEWAPGSSGVAVATLSNAEGAHTEIVLVNVVSGDVHTLVEGDELWHPNLWFADERRSEGDDGLDLDSACIYMTGVSDVTTRIMKVKMDYFWQYRDSAEAVIIGSSRSFAGMDPTYIKSHFSINMSYSAQDLTGTLFYIKNYILPLMPKLKVVVLTLDYDRWYVKDENWIAWFSDIPGYEYDKNHGFWSDGVPENMDEISRNALNPPEDEYELYGYHRGTYHSTTEGWGEGDPDVSNDSLWFAHDSSAYVYNLSRLSEILDLARYYDVQIVGVVYPQSPKYLETGAWGRYGPTRKAVKVMQKAVQKLTEAYPNFTVMDEYHDGHHDFTYEEFSNNDHLGLLGAKKMAVRLDSLLSKKKR